MPRKSRHLSHILMLAGILFAALLFAASIFVPKLKLYPTLSPQNLSSTPTDQNTQTGDPSGSQNSSQAISIDTSNWKTYKDPTYHFTIKYPAEWPDPKTQKINDPDYKYEYEADFGTADTLDGNGFEGFSIFIFTTEKCSPPNQSSGSENPSCATKKTKVSNGTDQADSIIEFSTMAYTYTIVPYIPSSGADPQIVKKASLELNEAEKTFSYDPNLKIIKPTPQKNISPPKPPTPIGKRGKLTGAVSAGGRLVCPHPNRKPTRSPNQGNHVDEDCCPDPDEWPNIACSYKTGDYKIMLKVK
jgi:hypothetical protein